MFYFHDVTEYASWQHCSFYQHVEVDYLIVHLKNIMNTLYCCY
jgi:hypothetical protein